MSNNIDLYVQEIEDSKQQIKQAIMVKGVTPTGGLSSYPEAILQIENNKKPELTELIQSIENNGLYEFYPEEGKDGFSSAYIAVDVPIPTFTTQTKSITVTQNGDYSIEPDSEYDGLSSVEVSVNVPTSSGDKQIVPNGFAFKSGDMSQIDFSQYDWSMVYDGSNFFNATNSTSVHATNSTGDWSNFEQNFNSKLVSTTDMFSGCTSLTSVPQLDTSKVIDMSNMFASCYALTSVPLLDTSNVTDMSGMFYNCGDLTSVPLLDTSNVKDMYKMFSYCYALTSIPQLDTSNVTDMYQMFHSCSSLTSVPPLDTSNVTNMYQMFYDCTSLTSVSLLDTSKVTDMYQMFYNCNNLTSIPQLDTSKLTNMQSMFHNCSSLTEVRFKGNPSKVSSMINMFAYVTTTGTLYYDSRYDYSKIIAAIPPRWTAVPYDVEEYESQLNQSN